MPSSKTRHLQKKAVKYVKQDRPQRLRELVEKHHVDLSSIEVEGGGNLLHWCLKQDASSCMLDYLLSQAVSPKHRDSRGDLPIDVAIRIASDKDGHCNLQYAEENIFPLLWVTRHGWRNHLGCRTTSLYKRELENCLERLRLRWRNLFEFQDPTQRNHQHFQESEETGDFQERFQKTFETEQRHFDPFPGWSGAEEEAAAAENGDWFESVRRQKIEKMREENNPFHWFKPRTQYHHSSTPPPPPGPQPSSSWSQPRSSSRRHHSSAPPRPSRRRPSSNTWHRHSSTPPPPPSPPSRPSSQPRSQVQSRMELSAQKADYERRYSKTLSDVEQSDCCLTFNDIPWPAATADSAMKVLFVDLEQGSDEYRSYLRLQLRRWHPDKIDQVLGRHLCQEDKPKIMLAVKELAQCLNKLA